VNNRFETIKTQEERALIPELLQLVITNGDMKELLGVDYYAKSQINPRAQNYFYINKFMSAFVDRPQIKTELFKWRVSIDKSPMSMSFQKMQFNPSINMISPQGPTRIERNLNEATEDLFYQKVVDHR